MAFIAFHAVRVAVKPADAEHNYGHGKVEALAALVETGFPFRPRGFRADRGGATGSCTGTSAVDANPFAFAVLIVSIARRRCRASHPVAHRA